MVFSFAVEAYMAPNRGPQPSQGLPKYTSILITGPAPWGPSFLATGTSAVSRRYSFADLRCPLKAGGWGTSMPRRSVGWIGPRSASELS